MNITDVGHLTDDGDEGDDKLIVGALRERVSAWELAKKYETLFFQDCSELNVKRPTTVCQATNHIPQQLEMISLLESRGYTYQTKDGVYFDTSKYSDYGAMANIDADLLQAGKRVALGDKKGATDFALWKLSAPDVKRDMEWDSPWGRGFPGWHIECSAMANHYLGKNIDIHTGGTDHIPVHHTNEIAQSECAFDSGRFVNYWLHCQFLTFSSGEKISKSSGHDLSVDRLKGLGVDPLSYRYFCLTAHYRNYLNYTDEAVSAAARALKRLRKQFVDAGFTQALLDVGISDNEKCDLFEAYPDLFSYLADDLNTPSFIAGLWDEIKSGALDKPNKAHFMVVVEQLLGLSLWVKEKEVSTVPDEVRRLLDERIEARKQRDWERADVLRQKLEQLGFGIEDTADGAQLIAL